MLFSRLSCFTDSKDKIEGKNSDWEYPAEFVKKLDNNNNNNTNIKAFTKILLVHIHV